MVDEADIEGCESIVDYGIGKKNIWVVGRDQFCIFFKEFMHCHYSFNRFLKMWYKWVRNTVAMGLRLKPKRLDVIIVC